MSDSGNYPHWSGLERPGERLLEPPPDPWDSQPAIEQEPEIAYQPIHPYGHGRLRAFFSKLAVPFFALGALILKFKTALLLAFKFPFVAPAVTMLVSVAAYATIWGWQFALGFVLLLFVHESGHLLEARRQGLPVSAPIFVPFLGAAIMLRKMPHNAWREARLALAGPIVGSLGAAAVWALSGVYDSDLLLAIAYTGFFINLFNLLPVVPLDGGRIASALHPALWFLGIAALIALFFAAPNPILLIIAVLAASDLYHRWQTRHEQRSQGYYEVRPFQRFTIAVLYFGLAVTLVLAMAATHVERTF
jgi:Zn-dependent protease